MIFVLDMSVQQYLLLSLSLVEVLHPKQQTVTHWTLNIFRSRNKQQRNITVYLSVFATWEEMDTVHANFRKRAFLYFHLAIVPRITIEDRLL